MKKRVLIISGWVVLVAGASVLLGFAKAKRNSTLCKTVDISVAERNSNLFITSGEVRALIASDQHGALIGKAMDKINLPEIEQMLEDNSYIINAQVYATLDGSIKIKVEQKNPIARIMSNSDSYYIDSSGYFMPLTGNCTPRVLIINGQINEPYSANYNNNAKKMESDTSVHSLLPSAYKIASYIHNSNFWKAQVTQLYVDSVKDFVLIPRVGCQHIILGDTTDLKQKFDKLYVLYKNGFNSNGKWNEYATINLKYKHQIICTKK